MSQSLTFMSKSYFLDAHFKIKVKRKTENQSNTHLTKNDDVSCLDNHYYYYYHPACMPVLYTPNTHTANC